MIAPQTFVIEEITQNSSGVYVQIGGKLFQTSKEYEAAALRFKKGDEVEYFVKSNKIYDMRFIRSNANIQLPPQNAPEKPVTPPRSDSAPPQTATEAPPLDIKPPVTPQKIADALNDKTLKEIQEKQKPEYINPAQKPSGGFRTGAEIAGEERAGPAPYHAEMMALFLSQSQITIEAVVNIKNYESIRMKVTGPATGQKYLIEHLDASLAGLGRTNELIASCIDSYRSRVLKKV